MKKIQLALAIGESHFEREFIRSAEVRGVKVKKILESGPSGGWPEYEISSENDEEFYSFLEDVGFEREDIDEFLEAETCVENDKN